MRLLQSILLIYLLHHVSCKTHSKSLTESMGQEVIEIGKIKDLPQDLEEEPSAENEDNKHTITTVQAATKKDFPKAIANDPNKKVKDIDQIDGRRQDDEEARIEKELADIYKDSLDYKADSAEIMKEVNASVAPATPDASSADVNSTDPELVENSVLRARRPKTGGGFKFQPDSNKPHDVARFRTSVDEISCDNKLSAKFEPLAIEPKMYGKFYNGDSYIVLKTTGDNTSTLSYDVHFWLGSKTTQDKKGAAAILTITLDDKLGGRAVHHREVQGHETGQFLGYFQPAIRYLEGGNESGFNEVETNAGAEKRLLQLSGCENMRIEEVPAEGSSLTKDHCFILEVEHDIFVLMPDGARATQRRKIISVANSLRDDYHNGRATIDIIDEFSSDADVERFFEALGSGSKEDLIDDDLTQMYTREDMSAVYFYKVLVGDEIELVLIDKPFRQRQLSSEDVFILDTPCSGVYVWLGKDVDPDVKQTYNNIAQQYLDVKGYPAWVPITRVSEGAESSTFKQYFHTWDSVRPVTGGSVKSIAAQIEAGLFSGDSDDDGEAFAKFVGKSAAARGYMPDEGAGELSVFRASEEPEDITASQEEYPKLYQSDVYVVRYRYKDESGEDATVVYLWIGETANAESKETALKLVAEIEEELEGNVTIVKIPQGKETKHFLSIFKGNLVILCGSKDEKYKAQNFKKSYEEDGVRLFRVEGTQPGVDMRVTQVEECTSSLEDDDIFVLETRSAVYVWSGKESSEQEQQAAKAFVSSFGGHDDDRKVMEINQGDEPDEFWEVLGGPPDENKAPSGWEVKANRRVTTPLSLTAVAVRATGKVKFEELPPTFTQKDLSDDGVYILDGGEELYVWLGKNISERIKAARLKIIGEYLEDDGLERTVDSAIVVTLKQGKEPAIFKKLFPEWDDDLWDNQASYEDIKNETMAANS